MSPARNPDGGPARRRSNLLPPLLVAAAIALWALFGPDLLAVPPPPLRTGVLDRMGPGLLLLARDSGLIDRARIRISEISMMDDLAAGLHHGTFDAATLSMEDALVLADAGSDIEVLAVLDRRAAGDAAGPAQAARPPDLLVVRRSLLDTRRDDLRALASAWFSAVQAVHDDRERSLAQLAASLGQDADAIRSELDDLTLYTVDDQQALLLASPPGLLEEARPLAARMVREQRLHGDGCADRLLGVSPAAGSGRNASEQAP